jgi:arginyl-tRNA synthetase
VRVTDLFARLSAPIAGAAASLADGVSPEVGLERPADATHGDFATSVALRLAPVLRRAPRQIAEDIAARIRDGRDYAAVEVAGAGFVNLRLSPTWFHDAVAEIAAAGDRYGEGRPAERRNVLVELVSANPTGEVTVASARNGAYGDSVGRLVEFAGHDVVREYYFNDAGAQVDKFGASVRARRRGDEIPEGGYPGEIVKVLAGEIDLDPDAPVEAWTAASVPRMFDRIKAALARLRISVDIWFSEAELHASGAVTRAIAKARAAGHVYEQGGATWLATSQFGDDKDRVLIKSDGSPAYFAADLAYIEHKFERGHDRLIYILGADHHGYVARLKAAAACMGYDPNAVEVPIYQMVTVSGERMGKRRGNAITADELMDAIGIDATRFFLVQRSHDQTMDIDLDLAVRQERENPVYYVQYAHARAQSILRRAAEDGDGPTAGPWSHAPEAQERDLVKRLVEWPDVVRDAADRRAPHRIVAYVHQLAGDFHVFHHDLRVLHDDPDTRAFRLTLTAAVGATVRRALDVIGVEAPDTM